MKKGDFVATYAGIYKITGRLICNGEIIEYVKGFSVRYSGWHIHVNAVHLLSLNDILINKRIIHSTYRATDKKFLREAFTFLAERDIP